MSIVRCDDNRRCRSLTSLLVSLLSDDSARPHEESEGVVVTNGEVTAVLDDNAVNSFCCNDDRAPFSDLFNDLELRCFNCSANNDGDDAPLLALFSIFPGRGGGGVIRCLLLLLRCGGWGGRFFFWECKECVVSAARAASCSANDILAR